MAQRLVVSLASCKLPLSHLDALLGNLGEVVRQLYICDVPEQIDPIQEQQVDNRNQELPSRLRHVLLRSVNLQPPISAPVPSSK